MKHAKRIELAELDEKVGDVISSVTDMTDVHASVREGLVICRKVKIVQIIANSL